MHYRIKVRDEKLGDFLISENLLTEQQLIEVLEFQLGISPCKFKPICD